MSIPIEDYGYIGNTLTGALISREGSMDWLCPPRFDDDACFAALLGGPEHGRWLITPAIAISRISRRYQPDTAILETTFETESGSVTLIDFMPFTHDERRLDVIRLVRGDRGAVPLRVEFIVRFGYGRTVPWVRQHDYGLTAVSGPDGLLLRTPVDLHGEKLSTVAEFTSAEGETTPFTLSYFPSHFPAPDSADPHAQLEETARHWRRWTSRSGQAPEGSPWAEAVRRSLITLKALTFTPTGALVAAPTTSLPENVGGERNWDYRFCWIRDATLTLYALLISGHREEAVAWRDWLLRAAAGEPSQLQVIYKLGGERRLNEFELPWLPGYDNSKPVRVGNAAYTQHQLDVHGELMDVLHVGRKFELEPDEEAWRFQLTMLEELEQNWDKPDEGIWEVRGGKQHFTHSRLMCWVAFDRGVKAVEDFGLPGPAERWRKLCQVIRDDIYRNGWCEEKQSFVQHYNSTALDASLLLMSEVGFLAPDDPRFASTVEAIERELVVDGLVRRYRVEDTPDGLTGTEGIFLPCSFWLVDAYTMLGRHQDAVELFEHLLSLRNDLGLLAEEYDPHTKRQLGNFPQAFSHIALINSAHNLASARGPAQQRADRCSPETIGGC